AERAARPGVGPVEPPGAARRLPACWARPSRCVGSLLPRPAPIPTAISTATHRPHGWAGTRRAHQNVCIRPPDPDPVPVAAPRPRRFAARVRNVTVTLWRRKGGRRVGPRGGSPRGWSGGYTPWTAP